MAPLYHETQWADVANAAIYGIFTLGILWFYLKS
jgi:hypothetical protein